jgi:selenide,water dikinase
MGITNVNTVLMILSVSTKMSETEKHVCTSLMIKGFSDTCVEAGTEVTGGQTVFNPWVMIGGTAMAVIKEKELIRPNNAVDGDVLVLTKPLAAQMVVNFNQYLKLNNDKWKTLQEKGLTEEEVISSYDKSVKYMSTLNLQGAKLMQKYKAHAATDVTGFGILGHAQNLATAQYGKVDLVIDTYPVLGTLHKYDKVVRDFKLKEGKAAETSGGLLIAMSRENAEGFLKEFKETTGTEAWIVGEVIKGENKAIIKENLKMIEV